MKRSDLYDGEQARVDDIEANIFAVELLMPWEWICRDVDALLEGEGFDIESDPNVAVLAERYRVSEQVMTLRIAQVLMDRKVL